MEVSWGSAYQGPSEARGEVQSRQLLSCTGDSAPSEATKRGSGGGSPRKYDDLLTALSDLACPGKNAHTKGPSEASRGWGGPPEESITTMGNLTP
jgi:hypothetical protein